MRMKRGPNPGTSEKQIAQGIKNNAEMGILNTENNESSSIGNDAQFEIPLAGGLF